MFVLVNKAKKVQSFPVCFSPFSVSPQIPPRANDSERKALFLLLWNRLIL